MGEAPRRFKYCFTSSLFLIGGPWAWVVDLLILDPACWPRRSRPSVFSPGPREFFMSRRRIMWLPSGHSRAVLHSCIRTPRLVQHLPGHTGSVLVVLVVSADLERRRI